MRLDMNPPRQRIGKDPPRGAFCTSPLQSMRRHCVNTRQNRITICAVSVDPVFSLCKGTFGSHPTSSLPSPLIWVPVIAMAVVVSQGSLVCCSSEPLPIGFQARVLLIWPQCLWSSIDSTRDKEEVNHLAPHTLTASDFLWAGHFDQFVAYLAPAMLSLNQASPASHGLLWPKRPSKVMGGSSRCSFVELTDLKWRL